MLNLFSHYLYEYKKGLRNLALYTGKSQEKSIIVEKLRKKNIAYYVHRVNENKMNVFFGDAACVDIVREMGVNLLADLTPEKDFVLGIMLGYDRLKQCQRYLRRKKPEI